MIVDEAGGIEGRIHIMGKSVPVEPVQSVVGSKPHETFPVLDNTIYIIGGKSVGLVITHEFQILVLCRNCQERCKVYQTYDETMGSIPEQNSEYV